MCLPHPLSLSSWGPITKYHRLDGLNNKFIFSQFWSCNSEIQVPVWLGSSENCLPHLETAALLCPHMSVCMWKREVFLSFSSYKATRPIGLEH